jgi:inner membrane protein
MPTIITHGFVGLVFGKSSEAKKNWLFWLLIVICSVIPDADVVAFKLGIPYGNAFGHRGFSHSIFFALLISIIVVLVFYRKLPRFTKSWWSLLLLFFLTSVSHSILDAMTNGGLGVAFFAPFSNQRYFFSFKPIVVAPLSISRFFSSGYRVILSEIIWVWIPCVLIASVFVNIRRRCLTSGSS